MEIIATHSFTVFEKDGYRICRYTDEKGAIFTACGNGLPDYARVSIKLNGEWGENKHGKCFYVKTYEINTDNTRESIILYLSCGMFPYIGLKTAESIYNKFGNDTLSILDENIYRLEEVKGLSPKKVKKIATAYESERSKKELVNFLIPFGIPVSIILRVEKVYENMAFPTDIREKITVEPYRLIDVKGISLTTINRIAQSLGSDMKTYSCFRAFAMNELRNNEVNGNTVEDIDTFGENLLKVLGNFDYTKEDILSFTKQMLKGEELVCVTKSNGTKYIGREELCKREFIIAKKFSTIFNNKSGLLNEKRVIAELDRLCEEKKLTLDEIQRKAVIMALTQKASVITGGGGTGKTTITLLIVEIYENLTGKMVYLLAPTGRASRVLADKTGHCATTIHSGIKIGIDEENENETDVMLENGYVICDEGSMVDTTVMWQLMRHISSECPFLFVGDIDQLPSVGCGAVLRDIIESNTIPVTRLEKIYRQKESSKINYNAQKIKKGDISIEEGDDFHFIECAPEELTKLMLEKTLEMHKKYGADNVMCLCPYKDKMEASVSELNVRLQERLNPQTGNIPSYERGNFEFRVGDLVMQTQKNRPECSNGDIGFIESLVKTKEEKMITVHYPATNRSYTYEDDEIDELILAYASTIHKAQGSQADAVVTCLHDFHGFMQKRNFLYTDVSRAKEEIWLYGSRKAVEHAILTEDTYQRETLLKHFLVMMMTVIRKEEPITRQITISDYMKG